MVVGSGSMAGLAWVRWGWKGSWQRLPPQWSWCSIQASSPARMGWAERRPVLDPPPIPHWRSRSDSALTLVARLGPDCSPTSHPQSTTRGRTYRHASSGGKLSILAQSSSGPTSLGHTCRRHPRVGHHCQLPAKGLRAAGDESLPPHIEQKSMKRV